MNDIRDDETPVDKEELDFDQNKLRRIRERVLEVEKEKLHMDVAQNAINEIEEIIREEIR